MSIKEKFLALREERRKPEDIERERLIKEMEKLQPGTIAYKNAAESLKTLEAARTVRRSGPRDILKTVLGVLGKLACIGAIIYSEEIGEKITKIRKDNFI